MWILSEAFTVSTEVIVWVLSSIFIGFYFLCSYAQWASVIYVPYLGTCRHPHHPSQGHGQPCAHLGREGKHSTLALDVHVTSQCYLPVSPGKVTVEAKGCCYRSEPFLWGSGPVCQRWASSGRTSLVLPVGVGGLKTSSLSELLSTDQEAAAVQAATSAALPPSCGLLKLVDS